MIKQFIQQGWVPKTCTLTEQQALMLWPIVAKGTDPCAGCNYDRNVCKGRPKKVTRLETGAMKTSNKPIACTIDKLLRLRNKQ